MPVSATAKSFFEEVDDSRGGEEHLVVEQNQIRVPQTKDQTLKECEYKSCGFPIGPAFLSVSREQRGLKTKSGKSFRAVPSFVSP